MTIGKFDGMHLGHIALIKRTIEHAKNLCLPSLVFTFYPNPISALSDKPFEPLLSEQQKISILYGLGIDTLINYPFDKDFADISPNAFIKLVFADLKCRALIVGEGFRFGKDRKGEASMFLKAGRIYGAIVEIFKNIELYGEPVSSTRIRKAIADGDISLAECLLGRPIE